MKDFFKRPVKRGDFFCYAMRFGNSSEMAVGIVLNDRKVWQAKNRWGGGWELNSKASLIGGESNMVWVTADSLPADIVNALRAKLEEVK